MDNIDDIIGLIIFILAGLAGIIGKARQDREEQRKRALKPRPAPRASDLPDSTRRQMYGPGEVRKARPLVVQPSPEAGGEGVDDEGWERVPSAPAPPTTRPAAKPRPVATPVLMQEQELEERRKQAELQLRQREEQARRRAMEEMRRRLEAERASKRPSPKPPRPPVQQRPQIVTENVEGEPRPKPVQHPQKAPRRAVSPGKRALLGNTNDLRKAIVLREILGPPRGLE